MSRKKTNLSRREFLKITALGAASMVLSGHTQASDKPIKSYPQQQYLPSTTIKLKEAPELAERVKAGALPPLAERLPTNPLVLTPINRIGRYGGRIRSSSPGWEAYWEASQYGHSPLRLIDDGMGIIPGHIESWETNANNTEWTLHFRQGLKWSDGHECTTADVMYWWEGRVLSVNAPEAPPELGVAGGQLAEFTAIDQYTLKITFTVPAPLTAKRLAMWVKGNIGNNRWICPKHYLQPFDPNFNPAMVDWATWEAKALFRQNPDCPSLDPWICSAFVPWASITWERNPYYYVVDPQGRQLPYIDGIDETIYVGRDSLIGKISNGQVDFSMFTYQLGLKDILPLQAVQDQGGFELRLWNGGSGTGMVYFWNNDHPDEKKRALYRNPKFKQAMSFALDRPTLKKSVYLNYGMITTGSLSPNAIEFNYNEEAQSHYIEFRDAYSTYDPDKAKSLLDEIGVVDVDMDGWREYADGSKLTVRIDLPNTYNEECGEVLSIAVLNWQEVGLNVILNILPPVEFDSLWTSGQGEIHTNWEVGDGLDHLTYPAWVVPNEPSRWAPLGGNTLAVRGTPKENTECELSPWSRNPPRYCDTDPQYAGTPVASLHQLYQTAIQTIDEVARMHLVWQMNDIHINNGPFYIGTVCNTPRIVIVSKRLDNVPTKEQLRLGGFVNPWVLCYPAITNPETYYYGFYTYMPLIVR